MKTQRLVWTLGWITMSSLAALQGCGDDEEETGTGGKGGTSGAAGEAGDGGTSGTAGGGATGGSAGGGRGGTGGQTGGSGGSVSGAGGAPGGVGGEGGNGEGGSGPQTRGELCVEYCTIYFANMCHTYTATNMYNDQPTCEFVCANSTWEIGETGETGDTIWCRIDHANNAEATAMRELHCGHASQTPTGVCI